MALLAGTFAVPALAQSSVESRVGRLESEMRAVQRRVFPGGTGGLVEPQITAPDRSEPVLGAPATTAVADLTARVSALESQMTAMTGQIEQAQYRLRQLEEGFAAYRKTTDAKLAAAPAPAQASTPVAAAVAEEDDVPAAKPAAKPVSTTATKPAATGSARAALVAKVEKPETGDAAEDSYLYGYRLWDAKLYPEAQTQLKKTVADFPKSRRASYAQNLLGRAYLDDGKPSLASMAFYDNYKKMPDGERAPDSLYYLGQSLMKLNKPADACKVYGELTEVYGASMATSMKDDVARARTAAKCK